MTRVCDRNIFVDVFGAPSGDPDLKKLLNYALPMALFPPPWVAKRQVGKKDSETVCLSTTSRVLQTISYASMA